MLSPFYIRLQVGFLCSSAALLWGAFYGMRVRAENAFLGFTGEGASVPTNGSEKRRAHRQPCNLVLEFLEPGNRISATGRVINLSATGACLMTTKTLTTGDYVLAQLPGMRKGGNTIAGCVVWTRSAASSRMLYGIRFNPKNPA